MDQRLRLSHTLKYDLSASIVVFLVALPLCLGIALASGAPLFSGIIAGVVGGIVVGALSGSPLSVSGPAAGLTVIVLSSIQKLPSYEAFLLAVMIGGVIQIGFGALRAGVVADFIPSAVIRGMLSAIGILLILKQFPHAIGYDKDYEGDESFIQPDGENTFSSMLHVFDSVSLAAVIISVVSILILVLWDKPIVKRTPVLKLIPGPLLVVVFGIGAQLFFQSGFPELALRPDQLVTIPVSADFASFVGQFRFPDFGAILNQDVWIVGGTLAIVASIESLLSLEAVDKLDPFKRNSPPNRELMAQGAGNILSGLIGGLPLTSVIVRSSANVNSGARNKTSAILHGLMLLLAVYFIPTYLNLIPLSCLAGILIMTGFKLAHPSVFKRKWIKGRAHFIPFTVTIVAIVLTDLLVGIMIGIGVGAYFVFMSNYHAAISVTQDGKNYLLRVNKELSFINKSTLKQTLAAIEDDAYVIIDLTRTRLIDLDNAEVINDFLESAKFRNIRVEINRVESKPLSAINEPIHI